jgi:hypothetical protein
MAPPAAALAVIPAILVAFLDKPNANRVALKLLGRLACIDARTRAAVRPRIAARRAAQAASKAAALPQLCESIVRTLRCIHAQQIGVPCEPSCDRCNAGYALPDLDEVNDMREEEGLEPLAPLTPAQLAWLRKHCRAMLNKTAQPQPYMSLAPFSDCQAAVDMHEAINEAAYEGFNELTWLVEEYAGVIAQALQEDNDFEPDAVAFKR